MKSLKIGPRSSQPHCCAAFSAKIPKIATRASQKILKFKGKPENLKNPKKSAPEALDPTVVQHFPRRFRKAQREPPGKSWNPKHLRKSSEIGTGSSRPHRCATFFAQIPKIATAASQKILELIRKF